MALSPNVKTPCSPCVTVHFTNGSGIQVTRRGTPPGRTVKAAVVSLERGGDATPI